MYTQDNEESIIREYFSGRLNDSLFLLDIGANDGETLSNSRQLILDGWRAILVEPSRKALARLKNLYAENHRVKIKDLAISKETGEVILHESGSWNSDGRDIALFSTVKESELERWGNRVTFTKISVNSYTFSDFIVKENLQGIKFDFITIAAEGLDWDILEQIDLTQIGCDCLCIEWNSIDDLYVKIKDFCEKKHGMREHLKNRDNLIFVR